jgi:hypothetical protein
MGWLLTKGRALMGNPELKLLDRQIAGLALDINDWAYVMDKRQWTLVYEGQLETIGWDKEIFFEYLRT